MRNVPLSEVDGLDHDVLPIATDYPDGLLLPRHAHRRAQVLHAATGVMVVEVDEGSWTVPVAQAVLIPPELPHEVRMLGVRTMSLYIEPTAVPWWPRTCTVIAVSPLLRELLAAAADFPPGYDPHGRPGHIARLILLELAEAAPLPLSVPLPADPVLRRCCLDYLDHPSLEATNAAWAAAVGLSERTLDRRFRTATGLSPAAWRGRARILAAVPLLATDNVTQVASRLGYATPAAFTAAFTRVLRRPPSAYRPR